MRLFVAIICHLLSFFSIEILNLNISKERTKSIKVIPERPRPCTIFGSALINYACIT